MSEKIQAHKLTVEQMKDLQYKQIQGEGVEMITAPNGYKLPRHEQNVVHAQLQYQGFNPATGEPTSKPFVQKFDVKEFEKMQESNAFAGVKVEVLHDGSTIEGGAKKIVEEGVKAGTIDLDSLPKNTVKELEQILKSLYPLEDQETVEVPVKKADLIQAIEERQAFLDAEKEGK